ncbi:UNVERIFIED_CONTAM: hypothetical protein NCL1_17497 [Trichonephila clavipes]
MTNTETSKYDFKTIILKIYAKLQDLFTYFRDLQDQEHREWKERFENCDKELAILRDMLSREQEWRVQVEADCRKLKNDNQMLKNGILEKEKNEQDNQYEVSAIQRDVEKLKSATSRPPTTTSSPSRRHSVWPVISYPKKW